jgi:hypothetical protein
MKVEPFLRGYGHDREFAADRDGVKLAVEAGIRPGRDSTLDNVRGYGAADDSHHRVRRNRILGVG